MAFGFFKKKEVADVIFTNGKVYTQDPDYPWAEAVACRGGRIIAVGDAESAAELADSDTEVVDLGGGTLLPGFIDLNGAPAKEVFKNSYKDLSDKETWEDIIGAMYDLCDNTGLFGFGEDAGDAVFAVAKTLVLPEDKSPEEVHEELDTATGEKPVVIFFVDSGAIVMNTVAIEMVKTFAEENEIQNVTLAVVVGALELIDFDELQQEALSIAADYCDRGYTSIVNNGFVEFFDSAYTDMVVEQNQGDMLKQRLFGRFGMRGPGNPLGIVERLRQRLTYCMDMENAVNECGLLVDISERFEADTMAEHLSKMCLAAADAGFDLKLCVHDKEAAITALEVFDEVRNKGYRKNILTLSHSENFTDEERANYSIDDLVIEAGPIDVPYTTACGASNVSELVDALTIYAADELGMSADLGTIEPGKLADFVIYEENPLDCPTMKEFFKLHAAKTVVGGKVVYDIDEEVANEWYELLVKQQY